MKEFTGGGDAAADDDDDYGLDFTIPAFCSERWLLKRGAGCAWRARRGRLGGHGRAAAPAWLGADEALQRVLLDLD